MPHALTAEGADVGYTDYKSAQTKLIARFAMEALKTGPERRALNNEEWEALRIASVHGLARIEAWSVLGRNETVNYLYVKWSHAFAELFRKLAGDWQRYFPIEEIESDIASFQSRIVQSMGTLRHVWFNETEQVLPLQSAWEHIRWHDTKIREIDHQLYFGNAALFPYVVKGEKSCDLRFETGSVHPETFLQPLPPALESRLRVSQVLSQAIEVR